MFELSRDWRLSGNDRSLVDHAGQAPQISLPKGGGAIQGIGETFSANPVTGTGALAVPIATSPARGGFGPTLSLDYDSGAGNGPFGFGWRLSLPAITRRTDRGLPLYLDETGSDSFLLSGAEELVPVLAENGQGGWTEEELPPRDGYRVKAYRPRIEGLFARIERWTRESDGDTYWRTISRDNVVSFYGGSPESRIADPSDPSRVFSWLVCRSQDDRGNAILYSYAPEDAAGIDLSRPSERKRTTPNLRVANRYPSRIRYGNERPLLAGADPEQLGFMFEIVFDYGEGYVRDPRTDAEGRVLVTADMTPPGVRTVRQDPFSHYRAGFEIRTYRLCRRILTFHHFAAELGSPDCLVRATEFDYRENPVASFIAAVTQCGYARQEDGRYLRAAMPRLEFGYSEVAVDETVRDIDAPGIENLPRGVDGTRYQWVDLDSEGLAGVLSEQAGSWYYKRNLGGGTFAVVERVASRPSITALAGGRQHLLDLAGEGRLDLVQYDGPMPGYQTRTRAGGWERFTPFPSPPNVETRDPNLRFVDVTGDGFPDILVSEDTVFTWYESRAKAGYAPARRAPKSWDEEQGPTLVFADPAQTIFLADMSGDGLSDIVRIRYGEVCYWPNLGYGRFGPKVVMDGAPVFDSYDRFDPKRIRLADIDGSGTADIVYIGQEGVTLHFNQAGNGWGEPYRLSQFPRVDDAATLAVTDLKGVGTACLVWSSPLAADGCRPMRYIDLMGGRKPHLLVSVANNMGAQTEIGYAPSTEFYLRDMREGRPWVTRLPFPVHVVERVETRDLVSNTRLVRSYSYRHGYYDGAEREYRGFAYVEQRDVESVTGAFDLPPVVTRTWTHNGAFLAEGRIEAHFKDPSSGEYFAGDPQAAFLPEAQWPAGLSVEEMREAARALKGSILRQETYAEDGSEKAALPYSVSDYAYEVKCVQPRGPNRYGVFFAHRREAVDYRYERNPEDPRISHKATLAVDDYGNVLSSAVIGYRRRAPAFGEQGVSLATLTENLYTNPVIEADAYRAPLPAEAKTCELTAPAFATAAPLAFDALAAVAAAASEIAHEAQPDPGQTQKRPVGQRRILYRADDLTALLPLGRIEPMALPGESYGLALTPGLLDLFQANIARAELAATLTGPEAGYRDLDGDGRLWVPSGRTFHSPGAGDAPSVERAFAQAHFFLPQRQEDPFGNATLLTYDAHDLLLVAMRDAVGNEVSAANDYRVLQPQRVTDPNGNDTEARFDALGMLAGLAVRGKGGGPAEGDSFDGFTPDLAPAEIAAFFDAAAPGPLALAHLGTATSRIVHDLTRVPVCAASIAREIHAGDLAAGAQSAVQLRFVYSDGFGRVAQTRIQAEPGPLDPGDPASQPADPRWVGTGETIYNNKGKPIRQYEPFFSAKPQFGIETWGVSSTLFYDPTERVVAIAHPDHTYEKVVLDPWRQASHDVNDTATLDPKTDPDIGSFFAQLPDSDYLPTWYGRRKDGALGPDQQDAAAKTARHASTPAIAHFDALGRTFLTIADNGPDQGGGAQMFETRLVLDIAGKQRAVIDALGRTAMRYDYDLPGTPIHQASMEAGERWTLNDVLGKPIRGWNSRKYAFRTEYDALRRPVRSSVQGGDASDPGAAIYPQPLVYERTIYGDNAESGLSDAQQRQANLKARLFRHFDGAGLFAVDRYDFKGNALQSLRQFASDYRTTPDWSQSPALEAETFAGATAYDALNRPVAVTTPDGSVYRPAFNAAGLLETIEVDLRGASAGTAFVAGIDYNAKGQRLAIRYGNGARTDYAYDPDTFRLTGLRTTRAAGQNGTATQIFNDAAILQDLRYTHDPAGNVTRIADGALITVFNGQRVDPVCDYGYDPLYRLVDATGREHVGQSAFAFAPPDGDLRDYPLAGAAAAGDLQQLRNYAEHYAYDPVGNLLTMAHVAGNGAGNWTRSYAYEEASLLEPARTSNRLSRTALLTGANPPAEPYSHDAHGNITRMPHLPVMQWNFRDELSATSRQVVSEGAPETTYYVYDAAGRRVRKVTERRNGSRKAERFYLDGYETYREYGSGPGVALERETLHVMDGKQRVALVETQTIADGAAVAAPAPAQRYQFANHLGSASLELDQAAALIAYEEYSPYGVTTFQAGRSGAEVSLKRYRYTGSERDEESGFGYHGARYYAPWLGRWTSCDPASLADGLDIYAYVRGNPILRVDPEGTDGHEPTLAEARANLAAAQAKLKAIDAEIAYQKAIIARADAQEKALATLKDVAKKLAADKAELDGVKRKLAAVQQNIQAWKADQAARDKWNADHNWLDKLVTDYDTEKAYWQEKERHRDWEVKPNFVLDMTDSIVKATPSAAANTWSIFAGGLGTGGRPMTTGDLPTLSDEALEAVRGGSRKVTFGEEVWQRLEPGAKACQNGCEAAAETIHDAIGGEIYEITGPGPYLGRIRNSAGELVNPAGEGAYGWAHHHVVVKEGLVFDRLTGPEGMTMGDYLGRWEYGDALTFTPLD